MKQLAHVSTGLLAVMAIALLTSGCMILSVVQPSTVGTGDTVAVVIMMQDPNVPGTKSETDRFVLCARVPLDWTYLDGAYVVLDHDTMTTIIGAGTGRESQRWADSASLYFPPPAGMKWIGLLADSTHAYADTILIEAAVSFQAGTTTGTFDLWYLMTKNAGGLMDPGGMSQGWADTSTGNFITVTSGPTAVMERNLGVVPQEYALGQNYPNPFNPSTSIQYSVKEQSDVRLTVFDVSGKEIAVLVEGVKEPGTYEVMFSGVHLASGVYLYKLEAGSFTATRKMILTK